MVRGNVVNAAASRLDRAADCFREIRCREQLDRGVVPAHGQGPAAAKKAVDPVIRPLDQGHRRAKDGQIATVPRQSAPGPAPRGTARLLQPGSAAASKEDGPHAPALGCDSRPHIPRHWRSARRWRLPTLSMPRTHAPAFSRQGTRSRLRAERGENTRVCGRMDSIAATTTAESGLDAVVVRMPGMASSRSRMSSARACLGSAMRTLRSHGRLDHRFTPDCEGGAAVRSRSRVG